jgi:hypothetical protein
MGAGLWPVSGILCVLIVQHVLEPQSRCMTQFVT